MFAARTLQTVTVVSNCLVKWELEKSCPSLYRSDHCSMLCFFPVYSFLPTIITMLPYDQNLPAEFSFMGRNVQVKSVSWQNRLVHLQTSHTSA